MPRDAFVLKIQRELCHPKYARKVSGLSRNGALVCNSCCKLKFYLFGTRYQFDVKKRFPQFYEARNDLPMTDVRHFISFQNVENTSIKFSQHPLLVFNSVYGMKHLFYTFLPENLWLMSALRSSHTISSHIGVGSAALQVLRCSSHTLLITDAHIIFQ